MVVDGLGKFKWSNEKDFSIANQTKTVKNVTGINKANNQRITDSII